MSRMRCYIISQFVTYSHLFEDSSLSLPRDASRLALFRLLLYVRELPRKPSPSFAAASSSSSTLVFSLSVYRSRPWPHFVKPPGRTMEIYIRCAHPPERDFFSSAYIFFFVCSFFHRRLPLFCPILMICRGCFRSLATFETNIYRKSVVRGSK